MAEVAQRLLALHGLPAAPIARRIVAGLLGAHPEALPEELSPRELRPAEECAVAATPLARVAVVDIETTRARQRARRDHRDRRRAGRGPLRDRALRDAGAAARARTDVERDRGTHGHRRREACARAAPAARAARGRALARFARWLAEADGPSWVAHNARFDISFLRRAFERHESGVPVVAVLCTQRLARRLLPRLGRYDLDHVCAHFGVRNRARHRALGDADATAQVWIELLGLAAARGAETVGDLLDLQEEPVRRRRRRRARRPTKSAERERSASAKARRG
ncbi:MAG TPA: 3'-5' exonuclease [Myxococcota bacterium]|nr:3'-5' exonuclease [Myxococcota bacterium]